MKTPKFIVMVGVVAFWAAIVLAGERSQEEKFQQAIHLMETKGDYPAAIRLFEEVAKGPDRTLAARSLLYVGICYEKLGKDEAQKAYRRIIQEFADQHEVVTEARNRLTALTKSGNAPKDPSMVMRQVSTGADADITAAVSPDGRYLSFVDWETGDLAIRNLVTAEKRRLTSNDSLYAGYSAISTDGKQIAYAWLNKDWFEELRIIRLDGSEPRILYRNEEVLSIQPAEWSRDDKYILASFTKKDRTNQIVLVSVADGSVQVLKTLDWRSPLNMSFSPDGRYIVYDFPPKEDSPDRDLFLLATAGSLEIPLVEHPANDLFPIWAPDGKRILFASDRTGTLGIWVITIADGKPQGFPELVKPDIGRMWPIGFTQRGSCYYGLRTGVIDLYSTAIDPATGNILTPPAPISYRLVGAKSAPDWSPDGKYLAYISQRSFLSSGLGSRTISIHSVETGEERELSPKLVFSYNLRWSPDGRFILLGGSADNKNRFGVHRVDAQTGDVIAIAQDGYWAEWSRDGKAIFYAKNEASTQNRPLVVRDLETGQEKKLYSGLAGLSLALSPDGRLLAFSSFSLDEKLAILKVMPATGGEPRELLRLNDSESFGALAWMPGGRQLLFTRRKHKERTAELWRIPVEGGEPHGLGIAMHGMSQISVHPDGQRIAFDAGQNKLEIWVMENFLPELRTAQ